MMFYLESWDLSILFLRGTTAWEGSRCRPGMGEWLAGKMGAGSFLLTGYGIPDIFIRFPVGPDPGIIGNSVSIKVNSSFGHAPRRNTARWANFSRDSRTPWPG